MTQKTPSFYKTFDMDPRKVVTELELGLTAPRAHCSPKYFYNALGSTLFEAITHLPEYYPTRTEASILTEHASAIHLCIPNNAAWVDLGAGSCQKAASLFAATTPGVYVAVDISLDYLTDTLVNLQRVHPSVEMVGVGMDFSSTLDFPTALASQITQRPIFAFYPGSSLGNFTPAEALTFLGRISRLCQNAQPSSGLLIGIDLVKATDTLERAYDDDLGVTAAFNLNVLRHINSLLGSNFDVRDWRHHAVFNTVESRIEMHLIARKAVTVRWGERSRVFLEGEAIHTENSYKWTIPRFTELLKRAGFSQTQCWTDPQAQFALFWAS
jgi:dimethylhistidine N-methyltransferase